MNAWLIIIAVMVLSFIVQRVLNAKFEKYSKVPSAKGLTGAEVSELILAQSGIRDVKVQAVGGNLTDFYNPQNKTINLSENVYSSNSIAACAVAAHETGHAIQHATGYGPLRFRSAMIPIVTFANNTVQWVLLLGVLMLERFPGLIWIGIGLFAVTTLFSLMTLPVEIDASRRAVAWLRSSGISDDSTAPMAADALKWAAYTYVIAAIGSLATLFYYIGIANSRR